MAAKPETRRNRATDTVGIPCLSTDQVSVQIIKVGEGRFEVHVWTDVGMCDQGKITEHAVIGRVVHDTQQDGYFVERPQWAEKGIHWIRIPHSYVTRAAALKAITHPKEKQ